MAPGAARRSGEVETRFPHTSDQHPSRTARVLDGECPQTREDAPQDHWIRLGLLAAQLEKLCEVAEDGTAAVHVLPFTAAPWPGFSGFAIYGFPDDEDMEVVQIDGDLGAAIYEDKESIKSVEYTFSAALAQSLSARKSLDALHAARKNL